MRPIKTGRLPETMLQMERSSDWVGFVPIQISHRQTAIARALAGTLDPRVCKPVTFPTSTSTTTATTAATATPTP